MRPVTRPSWSCHGWATWLLFFACFGLVVAGKGGDLPFHRGGCLPVGRAGLSRGPSTSERAGASATSKAKCARQSRGLDKQIDDAVISLNALGAARAGRGLCYEPRPSGKLVSDEAGADICARLGRYVREVGRPPGIEPAGALRELLKSKDMYSLDRESTRRPYNRDLVRVVRDGITPRRLEDLLPEHARAPLKRPSSYIVKDDADMKEVEADLVKPYTDPLLKQRGNMLDLVRRLAAVGFIVYRRVRRCRVGVSTVA